MSEENKNNPELGSDAPEESSEAVADALRESALFGTDTGETERQSKPPRRVSLTAFVCTCVALLLASVMLTYTVCSSVFQAKLAEARLENVSVVEAGGDYGELEILKRLFEVYSFEELDEEQLKAQVLKAYVAATGDRYAEYYTEEEYKALVAEKSGDSQGIGINIIDSLVTVGGAEYKALKITNVVKASPAEKAGLLIGDYIVAVGSIESGEYTTLNELGYDLGLKRLQGAKGTVAEFIVCRPDTEELFIDFSIMRDAFTSESVIGKKADSAVCENTGIVKIKQFDYTTPSQLKAEVESLKAEGCDRFVFDVRSNPGGDLSSIVACLSYFLAEGDTVISIKDKAGNEETIKVAPVSDDEVCPVLAEDIGIYNDLNMVVLCNAYTASAAELFVANFKDHGLGSVIGTRTYGKGSAQSYVDLAYFGYSGVLKMTRHMYFPPSGVGYDGIGIEPNGVVPLSEEASKFNSYDIMGTVTDNQLVEAVKYFR